MKQLLFFLVVGGGGGGLLVVVLCGVCAYRGRRNGDDNTQDIYFMADSKTQIRERPCSGDIH